MLCSIDLNAQAWKSVMLVVLPDCHYRVCFINCVLNYYTAHNMNWIYIIMSLQSLSSYIKGVQNK